MAEVAHVIRGAAHRDQVTAWWQGRYAIAAHHAPKDYPKFPELDVQHSTDPAVDAEIQAIRRRVKLAYDTKKAMKRHGS